MAFEENAWIKNKTRQNDIVLAIFFLVILFNNFLRNLALKYGDLYMVTPVGIRVKNFEGRVKIQGLC
jgi:hypothetical protein